MGRFFFASLISVKWIIVLCKFYFSHMGWQKSNGKRNMNMFVYVCVFNDATTRKPQAIFFLQIDYFHRYYLFYLLAGMFGSFRFSSSLSCDAFIFLTAITNQFVMITERRFMFVFATAVECWSTHFLHGLCEPYWNVYEMLERQTLSPFNWLLLMLILD